MSKLTKSTRRKDGGIARSGLLKRPSVASHAPAGWRMPPEHREAAKRFDERHHQLSARCEKLLPKTRDEHLRASGGERGRSARSDGLSDFERALSEIRWNRYFVPEVHVSIGAVASKKSWKPPPPPAPEWDPYDTLWKTRAEQCDAKDLYDTEDVEHRMFKSDWGKALHHGGFERFLMKMDDDGGLDEDGDGISDEVQEVEQVLWEHHNLIYHIFDYYATLGASTDIFHIDFNAYQAWIKKCHIAVKNSKHCSMSQLDQLFALVNAGGLRGDKFNKDKAINRYEWLQLLVRIAICRYVLPRIIPDVSEALHHFFNIDLDQHVEQEVKQDSDVFREKYCYTEEVTAVIEANEKSLRVLYNMYASADGLNASAGSLAKKTLLSFDEWLRFVKDCRLIDAEFTIRLATMCFAWSRMRVVDESLPGARARMLHLTFEDFLEALIRMSCMKSLPFDSEIEEAGCTDAGHFVLELQCYPQLYANFIVERRQHWDEEPLQDVGRCLEHLLTIIIRTVEGSTKGQDNLSLTAEEAALFFKGGGAASSSEIMKEINKGTQDGQGNAPSKRSTPPGSHNNSKNNSRAGSKLGMRPPSNSAEKVKADPNKYRKKKFVEEPEDAPTGQGGSGQAALA